MFKKILYSLLLIVLMAVTVLLFNTIRLKSIQPVYKMVAPISVADSAVKHFQQGIRFKTISYDYKAKPDSLAFTQFHLYLQKTYPLFFTKLRRQTIAGYSLLCVWPGKNTTLKPVILMAHQDVVPVEDASRLQWKQAPFEAAIKQDTIWGRGSTDDKISLFGILEATERLLQQGYQPQRTIYFVFGHDEESGGTGVAAVAKQLEANHIKAEWVLDEGGEFNTQIPGLINRKVAIIGTSEKGYLSLDLSVNIEGGHSSMPQNETAIDVLTEAIHNLRVNAFKPEFSASTQDFFEYLGPEMPFGTRIAIANRWLFKKLLYRIYQKSPGGNALIRTTIAPTIIQAGVKDNVIPNYAHATVNFRILPGTSIADVIKHSAQAINDSRIKINKLNGFAHEASAASSTESTGFKKVTQAILQSYSNTLVAPFLTVGATDSRQFKNVSDCILRFSPVTDIKGLHGVNERVGISEYKNGINFYYQLLLNVQ